MDAITRLSKAAMSGDAEAFAEIVRLARAAPVVETKRTAGVEYRVLPATFETKAEGRRVIGYGSTFESPDRYDSHGDIVRPGAFAGSIARHKAEGTAPTMHDTHLNVIGKWDVFEEDIEGTRGKRGLYMEGDILDTNPGEDARKLIQAGIYRGLSIGYYTRAERFLDGFDGRPLILTKWGYPVREILEADIVETSVLAHPSNPYAEILEVRAARMELKHAAQYPDTSIDSLCISMAALIATQRHNAASAATI